MVFGISLADSKRRSSLRPLDEIYLILNSRKGITVSEILEIIFQNTKYERKIGGAVMLTYCVISLMVGAIGFIIVGLLLCHEGMKVTAVVVYLLSALLVSFCHFRRTGTMHRGFVI